MNSNYLQDKNLVSKDKLVSHNTPAKLQPINNNPLDEDEAIITLGAMVEYLSRATRVLENSEANDTEFKIVASNRNSSDWNIYVWWDYNNGEEFYEYDNNDLSVIYRTVQYLIPFMAGSNISWLADGIALGVE